MESVIYAPEYILTGERYGSKEIWGDVTLTSAMFELNSSDSTGCVTKAIISEGVTAINAPLFGMYYEEKFEPKEENIYTSKRLPKYQKRMRKQRG